MISASIRRDGVIDRQEFERALGFEGSESSFLARRLFSLFDSNSDSLLSFQEFVLGLNAFSDRASSLEKISFAFRMYDLDGDGYITPEELMALLKATLQERYNVEVSDSALKESVDSSFREADGDRDGRVSFDDFREFVKRRPALLQNVTFDVSLVFNRP